MTPAQFDGWQLHIARYPPPEFLLATILTALLPKSDKIFDLTGHWLESPAAREIRKAAEEEAFNLRRREFIQQAYREKRDREDAERIKQAQRRGSRLNG